jgi:hypothetical protein
MGAFEFITVGGTDVEELAARLEGLLGSRP